MKNSHIQKSFMDKRKIRKAIREAHENWENWKDVFEHNGPKYKNPLLICPHRFKLFCKEYSVFRTIKDGKVDALRKTLSKNSFLQAINDGTGKKFDRLEMRMRSKFGIHGVNRLTSVLSKVAAFLKPGIFVAWDKYARKGVNIDIGRKTVGHINTYESYKAAFEKSFLIHKTEIRKYLKKLGGRNNIYTEPCFQRRVLDCYLMALAGRWDKK